MEQNYRAGRTCSSVEEGKLNPCWHGLSDQLMIDGVLYQSHQGFGIGFTVKVFPVGFHRALADEEFFGNVLVGPLMENAF